MNRQYFCPGCDGLLNPGREIILAGVVDHRKGLILLSPEVGDYATVVSRQLDLQRGDLVELRCPVCSFVLTAPYDAKLAEIRALDESGQSMRVSFSRRYGQHATFVVRNHDVASFGEDAEDFASVNFFGAGRMG